MTEKVSVFIPVYNQKDLVVNTLESVLAQTFTDYKMVIGDDCSTDGTIDILKSYKEKYPDKIKLLLNDKNMGITANFNNILQNCEGEYVAILGGDDLMMPPKLEKQVALMEKNPDVAMCYHDIEAFDVIKQKTLYLWSKGHKIYSGDIFRELILNSCFISCSTVLIRKDKIPSEGYSRDVPRASDYLFFIEIAKKGKVLYLDEMLGKYIRHDNNITSTFIADDEVKCLELLEKKYPEYKKDIRKGIAVSNFICFLKQFKTDKKKSLVYLKGFFKNLKSPTVLLLLLKRLYEAFKRTI